MQNETGSRTASAAQQSSIWTDPPLHFDPQDSSDPMDQLVSGVSHSWMSCDKLTSDEICLECLDECGRTSSASQGFHSTSYTPGISTPFAALSIQQQVYNGLSPSYEPFPQQVSPQQLYPNQSIDTDKVPVSGSSSQPAVPAPSAGDSASLMAPAAASSAKSVRPGH
jgi:hypothetical protein